MDQAVAATVLGQTAASFVVVVDRVTSGISTQTYDFMRHDDYRHLLAQDVRAAMQVYWREILLRAHFGASSSLLRTRRWLEGICAEFKQRNYHCFIAAFRGWLEASADTFQAFQAVPEELAEAHVVIRRAMAGRQDRIVFAPELENRLIHFTHARRLEKGEEAPPSHRARQIKEYLESLVVDAGPRIADCYRSACEITHPAAASILSYVHREASSIGTSYVFRPDSDQSLITQFCSAWSDVMLKIMALGVSPPIFTLRLLNELPVAALHTKALDQLNVESRPGWQQLADRLRDRRPPRFAEWTP